MVRDICIIGSGSVTAVGGNAAMTAASVRANLSRFRESDLMDKSGEPMVLSMAEFIDDHLRGPERLLALSSPAAKEALSPILNHHPWKDLISRMPLCLGITTSRPGLDTNVQSSILSQLESHLDLTFSDDKCAMPLGHASGLMAMERAVQFINTRKAEIVLVGGADSYYDLDTLEWLDEIGRLHSDENKDGFIPGEGSGFCLVSSMDFANRFSIKPLARILSCVSHEEPNPFTSDGICMGKGLTNLLHRSLAGLNDGELADWTICDMNGESFRGMEWVYSYLRTGQKHKDPLEIWHPADCYGDIGAASGPVLAGLSIQAWQRGYARGGRSLIWTSSDDKQRSALLLQSMN